MPRDNAWHLANQMSPHVRVFLIDDSPAFLASAVRLLRREPSIEVLGSASAAENGLALLEDLSADVVLMDLVLPRMSGIEAARRIKSQSNPPRVVMISFCNQDELRTMAMAAGADDFLIKDAFATSILPAIERLCAASVFPS